MELTEVFTELETVFEESGVDEAWTDWMRDYTQRLDQSHDAQERVHLLLKIQEGESALNRVGAYLPDEDAAYDNAHTPRYHIEHLVHTLDLIIQDELQTTAPAGTRAVS